MFCVLGEDERDRRLQSGRGNRNQHLFICVRGYSQVRCLVVMWLYVVCGLILVNFKNKIYDLFYCLDKIMV